MALLAAQRKADAQAFVLHAQLSQFLCLNHVLLCLVRRGKFLVLGKNLPCAGEFNLLAWSLTIVKKHTRVTARQLYEVTQCQLVKSCLHILLAM